MAKRPNAANITHGLAQLGGGSKKDGGSGMMGGLQNVFKTGLILGNQMGLEGKNVTDSIEDMTRHFIEKR